MRKISPADAIGSYQRRPKMSQQGGNFPPSRSVNATSFEESGHDQAGKCAQFEFSLELSSGLQDRRSLRQESRLRASAKSSSRSGSRPCGLTTGATRLHRPWYVAESPCTSSARFWGTHPPQTTARYAHLADRALRDAAKRSATGLKLPARMM